MIRQLHPELSGTVSNDDGVVLVRNDARVGKVCVCLGPEHSFLTGEAVFEHIHVAKAALVHAQLGVVSNRTLNNVYKNVDMYCTLCIGAGGKGASPSRLSNWGSL